MLGAFCTFAGSDDPKGVDGLKAAGGAGLCDLEIELVKGLPAPLLVAAWVKTFALGGVALGCCATDWF